MDLRDFVKSVSWITNIAAPIWIILSIILIWILFKTVQQVGWYNKFVYWQIGLFIFVWLHPVYTSFLKGDIIVEIGNIVSLILTVLVFYKLKIKFGSISNWLIPQIIWLTIASLYIGLKLIIN
jgi:hypothetical protein